MKKQFLILITGLLLATILVSSCAGHKDCQGKKHKVKTEMGGWL